MPVNNYTVLCLYELLIPPKPPLLHLYTVAGVQRHFISLENKWQCVLVGFVWCVRVYVCVIIASLSVVVVLSHYRRGGVSALSVNSMMSPASLPLEPRTWTQRCPVVSCTPPPKLLPQLYLKTCC